MSGTIAHPTPFVWPNVTILSSELVKGGAHARSDAEEEGYLSDWDNAMGFAGQFGGGMLFPETLNTPLLKASLSEVLARMPFYSGRLVFTQNGRLDVRCNDAGARFVAASTSASIADVTAALQSRPYARALSNPWAPFWPPHDIDQLVRQQWSLAAGFVLHLSGGGSALWVAAHHCCADFESLQTLAAHWAAAYNAALAARAGAAVPQPQPTWAPVLSPGGSATDGGPTGGSTSVAAPDYEAALPEGLRNPSLSARRCESASEQAASAGGGGGGGPSVPARREVAEACWWSGAAVAAYAMYHMVWRGGGVETRCCHLPASRLAELKRQANAELAAEREQRVAGAQEAACSRGDAAAGAGCDGTSNQHHPGSGASGYQAGAATAPAAGGCNAAAAAAGGAGGPGVESCSDGGGAGVEWVSTNDALIARLLQVLHSLPLRRSTRLGCFVAADMRRRLSPRLPPSRLGNLLYSAHLGELDPSDPHSGSLGGLAAALRHTLTHHLVPQFRGCMDRTAAALDRVGPRRLVFAFCLEREARHNIFAPEGPVNVTNWDVRFDLWKFGPTPPLAFLPLAEIGPCVVLLHPAGPAREDGVVLLASMHLAAWRQLDATGRGLGSLL